jgi:hypothetical protein
MRRREGFGLGRMLRGVAFKCFVQWRMVNRKTFRKEAASARHRDPSAALHRPAPGSTQLVFAV